MAEESFLKDRFYGCVTGFLAGSSMGALTKGLPPEKVFQKYKVSGDDISGIIDAWLMAPARLTDVVERAKLIGQAIMEKQDRIRAEDLGSVFRRFLDPSKAQRILQPYEGLLLEMIRAEIPAVEIGRYCDYSGLNSFACACFPIGLINACDPDHAKEDAENTGRLYQTAGSSGVKWASIAATAVASAMRSDATVDSVLEDVARLNDNELAGMEIDKVMKASSDCKSFEELQGVFNSFYQAEGIPYAMSFCKETVTKALCIFRFTGGEAEKAAAFGAATGRDADSTASLAAAISGALGVRTCFPEEWVKHADEAEAAETDTFMHFTASAFSEGLYKALAERVGKFRTYMLALDLKD